MEKSGKSADTLLSPVNQSRSTFVRSGAALISATGSLAVMATAPAAPPGSGWDLTFADEFHGSTLDTMKWNYNYPWGPTHNHRAYMDPGQVTVNNDAITLRAVDQRHPAAPSGVQTGDFGWQSLDYTSGAINTNGKFNMTHGYIEGRMRMADATGTWPAFWMLKSGWPPEIDIMEFPRSGSNSTSQYHAYYHYTGPSGHASFGAQRNTGQNLTSGFHEFAVEWTPDAISFYFNGQRWYGPHVNASAVGQSDNMYLILNHAVGGWSGTPGSNFPADFVIDWVRVWEKRPSGASSMSTWNVNGGGGWDSGGNWNGIVPRYGGQQVRFGRVGTAPTAAVTWNNSRTIGGITFEGSPEGTTAYTIGSGGTPGLQFANGAGNLAYIEALSSSEANQTVNARLELYNHTQVRNNMPDHAIMLNGAIVGAGRLDVDGPGPVMVAAANSYTGGTTIDSGPQGPAVLRVHGRGTLGSGGVLIGSGGNSTTARLELASGITLANAISLNGRNTTTPGIVNISSNNNLTGSISLGVGGGNYWIQSDANLLTLANVSAAATGVRLLTLQGAGDGRINGGVQNGSGIVSLHKTGAGTWTLAGNNTYTGSTTANDGKLALAQSLTTSSALTVHDGATIELLAGGDKVIKTAAVTVAGKLDLADNKLITATPIGSWDGSGYAGVTGMIQSGRIMSKMPDAAGESPLTSLGVATAADLGKTTFAGLSVDPTDAIVMYTYAGDANLDGRINIDDYGRIDGNVSSSGSVFGWFNGDFNYDGKINIDDYGIIDGNINRQGAAFVSAAEPTSIVAVPEPVMLGLLACAAIVARRRRKMR